MLQSIDLTKNIIASLEISFPYIIKNSLPEPHTPTLNEINFKQIVEKIE
jgi:hypothetical protein